jgi:hypothetical protein
MHPDLEVTERKEKDMLINGVDVEKFVRIATMVKFYIPKVLRPGEIKVEYLRKSFRTHREARSYGEKVLERLKAWEALSFTLPLPKERGEEEGGGE